MKHLFSVVIVGVIIVAAAVIALNIFGDPEKKAKRLAEGYDGIFIAEGIDLQSSSTKKQQKIIQKLLKSRGYAREFSKLKIDYPYDKSVFPPDIVAPTFLWDDQSAHADTWLIDVAFKDASSHIYYVTLSRPLPPPNIDRSCITKNNVLPKQNFAKNWTPAPSVWEAMKKNTVDKAATVNIYGFNRKEPNKILSMGQVTFETSQDPVGAPIFYRDVPLMPTEVDIVSIDSFRSSTIQPLPSGALPLITWRLRDISRPESRAVMGNIPSCANCHSFSSDGKVLGMDIDGPQGDKGAYAFVPVSRHMVIDREDIISWNYSFKETPRGKKTIGFLSRISPDGQYVVTTVNESVFVVNYLNHEFLQVFFPTRGILAYYSDKTGEMKALPGADDPKYVHCDPVWSPDGKTIIFARAEAKDPYHKDQVRPEFANDANETQIKYDLYRIPFNDGKGGRPLPVQGASDNGMSNTFPKVSPDGKFIVFVKCKNGQLMRPDGRLWIIPFEGGKPREMTCNTKLMNSWHSFSPNSRWLVFSSKSRTFYTQMFLTHMDEDGNDSPPVLIPNSTADNRAVNLPEFVNISYDDLISMEVPAISHLRYNLQSNALVKEGRYDEAIKALKSALDDEKEDKKFRAQIYSNLGGLIFMSGKDLGIAVDYLKKSIENDPEYSQAYFTLGIMQERLGKNSKAMLSHEKAIQLDPYNFWAINRIARSFLLSKDPKVRNVVKALEFAEKACTISNYREPALLEILGGAYSEAGRMDEALKAADSSLKIARKSGRNNDAVRIEKEIALYKQGKPISQLDIPVP